MNNPPPASSKQPSIDRAAVRAKLAERRALTIQHFLAYRDARVYPINELPGGGFRHSWFDSQGHLCAAATLLSYDWGRDGAIRVGQDNVELKLADVTSGPLADWILTSGLTHHEIVAIQVPGWQARHPIEVPPTEPVEPVPASPRLVEVDRLYQIYIDVERQLTGLADESLDLATDALMKHPVLARALITPVPAAS